MFKKPTPNPLENSAFCGILPVNKSIGCTSFTLVSMLRRRTRIEKIGHAGTLDPFASGVMVLLIGRQFTRLSDQLLTADKQYRATVQLGKTTDSYDIDGQILSESDKIPTLAELETALLSFQGECSQIPPMVSCSKGTYIRSLAHDLGALLGSGAFLSALCRTRSGNFLLSECLDQSLIPDADLTPFLRKLL